MSKGIVAVSLLAVGLLAGLPAQASVIYTSRSSTVSGYCGPQVVGCTPYSQTSTDFSHFSADLSGSDPGNTDSSHYQVSQQSTLAQNQITVSMSAYKHGFDSAFSSFDLHFTVDAPTSFTMSGNLSYLLFSGDTQISLTGPSSFGFADVSCGMTGEFNSCRYSNQSGFPPPYSTTTLAPGLYELLVTASNDGPDYMGGSSTSTANFMMTFTPTVPIPAAVWLFVSGLLGLRRWLPKSAVAAIA
jgi:hypothetical protein